MNIEKIDNDFKAEINLQNIHIGFNHNCIIGGGETEDEAKEDLKIELGELIYALQNEYNKM